MQEKGLDSLDVWRLAVDLAERICRQVIPAFPAEEKWALAQQLRRSAQSIPANIAEGYGRYYYQEGVRFCYIARGSLEETYSHITLAKRLGYMSDVDYKALLGDFNNLRRMLNGYIAFLKQSKRGGNEPGGIVREEPTSYMSMLEEPETNPASAEPDGPVT